MAIAVDATSTVTGATGTSLSWSHTCTGSDRGLIVSCGIPNADTITGITYDGVSLTQIGTAQLVGSRYHYLWYLANPSTGSDTIEITSSNSQILRASAASYTGVGQVTMIGATNQNSSNVNSGNQLSVSVTTEVDNSWLVGTGGMVGSPISAGASTTERQEYNEGGAGTFDSNAAKSPTGSYSLAIQNDDSITRNMGLIVAELRPIEADPSTFTPKVMIY